MMIKDYISWLSKKVVSVSEKSACFLLGYNDNPTRDQCLELCRDALYDPKIVQFFPKRWFSQFDFLLVNLLKDGFGCVKYLDPDIVSKYGRDIQRIAQERYSAYKQDKSIRLNYELNFLDKEAVKALILQNVEHMGNFFDQYQNDNEEFILELIKLNPMALCCVSKKQLADKTFVMKALNSLDRSVVMSISPIGSLFQYYGSPFDYLSQELRGDSDIQVLFIQKGFPCRDHSSIVIDPVPEWLPLEANQDCSYPIFYPKEPCFVHADSSTYIANKTNFLLFHVSSMKIYTIEDLNNIDDFSETFSDQEEGVLFLPLELIGPGHNELLQSRKWAGNRLPDCISIVVVGDAGQLSSDMRSRLVRYEDSQATAPKQVEERIEVDTAQEAPDRSHYELLAAITDPRDLARLNYITYVTLLRGGPVKSNLIVVDCMESYKGVLAYLEKCVPKPLVNIMRVSSFQLGVDTSAVDLGPKKVYLFSTNWDIEQQLEHWGAGTRNWGETVVCLPSHLSAEVYERVYYDEGKCYLTVEGRRVQIEGIEFYDVEDDIFEKKATVCKLPPKEHIDGLYRASSLCTDYKAAKQIFQKTYTFLESDALFCGFQGSPAIGKDVLVEHLLQSVCKSASDSFTYCHLTAGYDLSLVSEAMTYRKEDPDTVLLIHISELNLCSPDELRELALFAALDGKIKIVFTQNDSQKISGRFSTLALHKWVEPLADIEPYELIFIVEHMWQVVEKGPVFLYKSDIISDYLNVMRLNTESGNQPTLRQLSRLIGEVAKRSRSNSSAQCGITDIYSMYTSEMIDVYTYFYRINYRLSCSGGDLPVRSSMVQRVGEALPSSPWASFDDQVCFSTFSESNEKFEFSNWVGPLAIRRAVDPGESILLCTIPNSSGKSYIWFKPDSKFMFEASNRVKNIGDTPVDIYVFVTDPIPFYSTHSDFGSDSESDGALPDFPLSGAAAAYIPPEMVLDNDQLTPPFVSAEDMSVIQKFLTIKLQNNTRQSEDIKENLLMALGLNLNLKDKPLAIVNALYKFCNEFYNSEGVFSSTPNIEGFSDEQHYLLWSLLSKEGVCRHQARILHILLSLFGIKSEIKRNYTHDFVIVTLAAKRVILDVGYFQKKDERQMEFYKDIKKYYGDIEQDLSEGDKKRLNDFLLNPHRNPLEDSFKKALRAKTKALNSVSNKRVLPQICSDPAVAEAPERNVVPEQVPVLMVPPPLTYASFCRSSLVEKGKYGPETIRRAIRQDKEHNLADWLAACKDVKAGMDAIALYMMEKLPTKECKSYTLKPVTKCDLGRPQVTFKTPDGTVMGKVAISKPNPISVKCIRADIVSPIRAIHTEEVAADRSDEVILTVEGPVLRSGYRGQKLLRLTEEQAAIISAVFVANSLPEITPHSTFV